MKSDHSCEKTAATLTAPPLVAREAITALTQRSANRPIGRISESGFAAGTCMALLFVVGGLTTPVLRGRGVRGRRIRSGIFGMDVGPQIEHLAIVKHAIQKVKHAVLATALPTRRVRA